MGDFLESNRILALDYGQRRIGIAISDSLRLTAQSYPTIKIKKINQFLNELKLIVDEKKVSEIVVGLPLNLKGEKGRAAQGVEKFIETLKDKFQIPVHSWDERWTSVAAHRVIWEHGKSPSRNKEKVDQIAAQIILQNYLDYLHTKSLSE